MRRMTLRLAVAVAAVVSAWSVVAAEMPVYMAVRAEKIRSRGGIGYVMAKIQAGQEVTVAYLGGSITAANGWRPKTTAWLQNTFPNAKVQRDPRIHRRHRQQLGRIPRGARRAAVQSRPSSSSSSR